MLKAGQNDTRQTFQPEIVYLGIEHLLIWQSVFFKEMFAFGIDYSDSLQGFCLLNKVLYKSNS